MITSPYLKDENGTQAQMLSDNYFAGSPVVIDNAHHEIHCGDTVSVNYVSDLTNAEVRDILFIIPNPAITTKRYHFYASVGSEAECDYRLYEASTTSANGTALTVRNRNRQDPVVSESEVLFFHTPTVTGIGNELDADHWGSGKSAGGDTRASGEWVLKNNTKYIMRITNFTTSANHIAAKVNIYVHPGV